MGYEVLSYLDNTNNAYQILIKFCLLFLGNYLDRVCCEQNRIKKKSYTEKSCLESDILYRNIRDNCKHKDERVAKNLIIFL